MFASFAASQDADIAALGTRGKSLLAGAIGGALLKQNAKQGAQRVALKCIYHFGINPEQVRRGDAKERDPNDAQFLRTAANISVVLDEEGQPQTMDVLPTLEVSPLIPPRGSSGGSPTESN